MNWEQSLVELDNLADGEYGCGVREALRVDEELAAKRLARLTGIMIKMPFARPVIVSQPTSETLAKREWHYDPSRVEALDANDPAWAVPRGIFESKADRGISLEGFVGGQLNESNWFLALLDSVQEILCKDTGFQEALNVQLDDWLQDGVKDAVKGLAHVIVPLVPWLKGHDAILAGLSLYIFYYGKKGFCKGTFDHPMVTTLGSL